MASPKSATANAPSALAAIPPPVTADRKTITNNRVRTASDVIAAFGAMYTADLYRSRQRAMCQSAVDNAPPYSNQSSRMMGTYGRSNFNPGFARKSTFREEAPYNELIDQMDILTTVPTLHGDENSRSVWEPILAEGFTKMLRRWSEFNYLWQYNVSLFVREGVSVATFDDEKDWRWSVYGLQHFKFPNESKPCEDRLDMVGWRSKLNCFDLGKKILNEKAAEKIGWNVKAVKEAIKNASAITNTSFDPEAMEARWKNSDILDGARAPQIETVNLLVREVDGTVTMLIAPKNSQEDNAPCLYEARNCFHSMGRFMTLYNYAVGTNGDLHSIRGHASRIFDSCVAATRALNAFVDMAMFSATPHLECANDDAMQSIPLRKVGYMTLVGQGNKFLETKVPNFEQNLIPLYNTFTNLFEGESSGASAIVSSRRGMERKTNLQEQNERMAEGQLTTSAMALFFPSWERHLKEVMRRVAREKYRADEAGGELVWWFRNYLKRNNVPLEALYKVDIDGMEVNQGIGRGSQMARMAVADAIMDDYDLYDEKGQTEAVRIRLTTLAGARTANKIKPAIPNQRPGQQVDNADDQNGFLCSGNPAQIMSVKVRPDQNSVAHVQTHLEFLAELWPMTEQQDQRAALTAIQPVWEHAVDDLQLVPRRSPLFKPAKQQLAQYSEWVLNCAKQLAAEEDRAADKQAQEGGGMNGDGTKDVGNQGPDASQLIRAADARAKLQFTVAKNEVDITHKRRMYALDESAKVQDMNLKNLEARRKLVSQ